MMLAAPAAVAQQNMYVIDTCGVVNVMTTSQVDYATFNAEDSWFAISSGSLVGKTSTSITASCSAALATDGTVKQLVTVPEVGVCYSSVNATPTINDDCLVLGSELKDYTFTISSLAAGTEYNYRAYVKFGNEAFYGNVASAKTYEPAPNDTVINGHLFVNLGLPSGILWAETNIGAATAADYGDYFAWGETATKSVYSWATYAHGSSSSSLSKYNTTDHKTTLDPEDDAAYVNWESPCRMPTSDELAELTNTDNCTWTWTTVTMADGTTVNGYKVVSNKYGNSIFLPASGYNVDETTKRGSHTYYWTSSLYSNNVAAYNLYFYSRYYSSTSSNNRIRGYAIRPVVKP